MYSPLLFNPIPVLFSLSTLFGVLVHDTKIDQFTTTYLATPAIVAAYDANNNPIRQSDPHTHTERVNVSQLTRSLALENPRMQPRQEDKKYVLQKNVVRGHHPFDNYNLPVIA